MQLAICDDDLNDLMELERLVQKYNACYPNLNFEIEKFSDPDQLLHKIQQEEPADLYILDILMTRASGIELGHEIRRNNNKSVIIYVTSSDGFAMEAYDLHAVRYLLKPVVERDFFEALDYALSHITVKKEAVFLVKTKKGLEAIPYQEIEYIENSSRKLEVHLTNGDRITSIFIRKSFDEEIRQLICARNFTSVHKSFLINMDYVRKLNQSTVIMNSGADIPISRNKTSDVKKEYLLFVSNQYQ